jgi:hypothetical protein
MRKFDPADLDDDQNVDMVMLDLASDWDIPGDVVQQMKEAERRFYAGEVDRDPKPDTAELDREIVEQQEIWDAILAADGLEDIAMLTEKLNYIDIDVPTVTQ